MNELAKNLWAFFFAVMFLGWWVFPILFVMVGTAVFLKYKYPGKFDKYL